MVELVYPMMYLPEIWLLSNLEKRMTSESGTIPSYGTLIGSDLRD